jgi:hypothetical protein
MVLMIITIDPLTLFLLSKAELGINFLRELTTDSTRAEGNRVAIREEARWVGDDLSDVEVQTSVSSSGAVDTSGERAGQAAVRDAAVVGSLGVGEGKTRWSGLADGGFMNVCGRLGGRHVVTSNT